MRYVQSANRLSNDIVERTYLLIDLSGSMGEEDYIPSRKEGALQASLKFIETKAKLYPKDQVGIIGFANRAFCIPFHQKFDGDLNALRQLVNQKSLEKCIGAGTDFTIALIEAGKGLYGLKKRADKIILLAAIGYFKGFFVEKRKALDAQERVSKKKINTRLIMLTDGHHAKCSDPGCIAEELKDCGVTIECIGIAGNRRDVDESLLKRIASVDENGKPRYCFIKDSSSLIKKYASMARHIRPV